MKVGVIMGGDSSEREVSMQTGQEMLLHLDRNKYEVVPIEISNRHELIERVKGIDMALLALHGTYGEDGTVQGALESMGIPYTGSGVLSSSICMNKDVSKRLMRSEGIRTPEWKCWSSMEEYDPEVVELLGFPLIVKPNCGGSSVGTELVRSREALYAAVQNAFQWDRTVMIEEYISGQEITCSLLNGEMLPIIGIRLLQSDWFDYRCKYDDGGAEEQVIQLSAEITRNVTEAALACYRIMKCSVYARVDMILRDGVPYVLEVNTLPGMTTNSLLPKSASAAGLTFSQLLDCIIEQSWSARAPHVGSITR
ncbi:D-alanine--D-alanine ligase [Paenibacillus sp. ACRRX]|uniref:D-alanine--D-alanine ligase n=1 Tax=Paenibacillus sp. ACRRX TaxID=2918206 RepID=UPI001EF4B72B|nr:D-alanine--D-alanine ligase [Paenibacillus sp. ACRRX]MCG7405942.1 D-alanine--D-alanine ligase [Paenibacillus sp. ACRRX]